MDHRSARPLLPSPLSRSRARYVARGQTMSLLKPATIYSDVSSPQQQAAPELVTFLAASSHRYREPLQVQSWTVGVLHLLRGSSQAVTSTLIISHDEAPHRGLHSRLFFFDQKRHREAPEPDSSLCSSSSQSFVVSRCELWHHQVVFFVSRFSRVGGWARAPASSTGAQLLRVSVVLCSGESRRRRVKPRRRRNRRDLQLREARELQWWVLGYLQNSSPESWLFTYSPQTFGLRIDPENFQLNIMTPRYLQNGLPPFVNTLFDPKLLWCAI